MSAASEAAIAKLLDLTRQRLAAGVPCVLNRALTQDNCGADCEACIARGGWRGRQERATEVER